MWADPAGYVFDPIFILSSKHLQINFLFSKTYLETRKRSVTILFLFYQNAILTVICLQRNTSNSPSLGLFLRISSLCLLGPILPIPFSKNWKATSSLAASPLNRELIRTYCFLLLWTDWLSDSPSYPGHFYFGKKL